MLAKNVVSTIGATFMLLLLSHTKLLREIWITWNGKAVIGITMMITPIKFTTDTNYEILALPQRTGRD